MALLGRVALDAHIQGVRMTRQASVGVSLGDSSATHSWSRPAIFQGHLLVGDVEGELQPRRPVRLARGD